MNRKHVILTTILTAGAMLLSCADDKNSPETPQPPTPEKPSTGDVRVLTTTANRSKDLDESWINFSTKDNMSPSTIRLVPSTEFQTMDGFGAAITGSTCYNLMRMKPADRKEFLTTTFSPDNGYGFSYVRISIGCSDFSLSEFTCCDKEGIENFALSSEDKDYVIPILKEILAINPDLKIMGTPWTAPRWMKVNNLKDLKPYNSWTSGQLNPKYYADYGEYFVKWIQAMKDNGIDIYSVTPQNEPLNRGNSASMYMGWEEERDFVKNGLGPALERAGLDTKVYAFDHNYNYDNMPDQKSYPTKIYQDSEAAQYLDGAAYHNYGGDKDELTVVHNATPGMDLVFTETSIGTWNDGQNLGSRLTDDMEQVALGTVNRWCKGVIVWNLVLGEDEDGKYGPYRPGGCSTCFGAVDINRDYTRMTKNSHYYIIAHMASVVQPDAVRIGTQGFTAKGLTYTAFKNPDNSYAIVMSNSSSNDIKATVDDGSHHFPVTVPARSAVSLNWK
ncbi:MAG: glucosylceramidase [Muribaculaceae bacterium]|nr:glucosylceramidase [Muribaculaceae bacterium]